MKKLIIFFMIFFIISCSPNYKEMSTEKIKVKLNKLIKKEKKGSLSTRDFEEIQKLRTVYRYRSHPDTLNELKPKAEEYIAKYNDEIYKEYETEKRISLYRKEYPEKVAVEWGTPSEVTIMLLRLDINELKPKAEEYIAKNGNIPYTEYEKSEYEVVSKYLELKEELKKREEFQLAFRYLSLKEEYEQAKIEYENLN